MKRQVLAAAAVTVLAFPAFAQGQTQTSPGTSGSQMQGTTGAGAGGSAGMQQMQNLTAAQFVQMTAMSDMFEMESSKLAAQKAQDSDTKQFAQRMMQDHGKTTQELKSLMQSANISGAQIPTQLDQKHQSMIQQLQQASGQQFDQLYERQQVQAHQEAVMLFQSYAQNGDNQQLRQFAQKSLPTLQEHLQMAQKLQQAGGPSTGTTGAGGATGSGSGMGGGSGSGSGSGSGMGGGSGSGSGSGSGMGGGSGSGSR